MASVLESDRGNIYMRKRRVIMKERLSWDEIKRQYPDKWVGLSEIEWEDEANVRSAVVSYVGDSDYEPLSRQIAGEDIEAIYTTPDNLCPLGVLVSGR